MRLAVPERLGISIAIADGTELNACGTGSDHVWDRIANHEAVFGLDAESSHRSEENVRLGLTGKTVCALDMVEVFHEAELGENGCCGRSAFGGGCGLEPAQKGKRFGDPWVKSGVGVTPKGIDAAVFLNPGFNLFGRSIREQVTEQIDQVPANIGAQELERDVGL